MKWFRIGLLPMMKRGNTYLFIRNQTGGTIWRFDGKIFNHYNLNLFEVRLKNFKTKILLTKIVIYWLKEKYLNCINTIPILPLGNVSKTLILKIVCNLILKRRLWIQWDTRFLELLRGFYQSYDRMISYKYDIAFCAQKFFINWECYSINETTTLFTENLEIPNINILSFKECTRPTESPLVWICGYEKIWWNVDINRWKNLQKQSHFWKPIVSIGLKTHLKKTNKILNFK